MRRGDAVMDVNTAYAFVFGFVAGTIVYAICFFVSELREDPNEQERINRRLRDTRDPDADRYWDEATRRYGQALTDNPNMRMSEFDPKARVVD